MLIGDNSKYLLKRVRAKAKLNEYHIPEHLHGEMEEDAKYLVSDELPTVPIFRDCVG